MEAFRGSVTGSNDEPHRHAAAVSNNNEDLHERHLKEAVHKKEQPPAKEKTQQDATVPAEGTLATASVLHPSP